MAALACGNTTSLPLAIIYTLVPLNADFFRQNENETVESIITRGTVYILLVSIINTLLRWTLGYWLLKPIPPSIDDSETKLDTELQTFKVEESPLELIDDDDDDDDDALSINTGSPPTPSSLFSRVKSALRILWKGICIFEPPVWAAVIALGIGLVPALKGLFFSPNNSNKIPPLGFFSGALSTVGKAVIPTILLCLGYNIGRGPKTTIFLTKTMIFCITFCRLVFMPSVLGYLFSHFLLHKTFHILTDKMMVFILCLESCTPTAIQLSVICTLHGSNEQEISTLLFYEYTSAAFFITAWVTLFMTVI
eukprot:TRINITY_DN2085_c0_g3_i1.p1 TRINITY_DN2085_c0_g3~~TRINITY_DN2085_c0_g3_i1.p1  ORF type:complete len:318 (-),score=29.08 TRINITY_DN2085_c0_g3_i1:133-1056(-)